MTKVSWNLVDLFTSIDDPRIDEVLAGSKKRAQEFRDAYIQYFSEKSIDAEMVRTMLEEYEGILSEVIEAEVYAALVFSTHSNDPKVGAFYQKIQRLSVDVYEYLTFLELGLSKLEDATLQAFLHDEQLRNYYHYLQKIYAWKSHHLTEAEENLIARKRLTGRSAFERLFNEELAAQQFILKIDGEKKTMTQAEILNVLYASSDQDKRKAAAKVFTKGLEEKKKLTTYIFNILAEDKRIDDTLRNFSNPESSRHLSNEIDPQTAEVMANAVTENYALVQRYYEIKKKLLRLDRLYDYDRYAPLNAEKQEYSFDQAKEIVSKAFEHFSPDFAKKGRAFFDGQWIDADLKAGKQGGAYCMYVSPQKHPYIMMNFTGSAHDVLTLAHELGHGIHGELAKAQTMVNYHWPLTLSETASIFAETITFANLVESIADEEVVLALYMQKIEGIFASVFRQISMYRFEQEYHNLFRKKGELTSDEYSKIWKKTQKAMFGSSVSLTKNYESWWIYISHFIHHPFYVYAYAFGELLTLSLVELWQKDPEAFVQKYLAMLASGGSKSPQELLEEFGIDLNDKNFWLGGIHLISQYLDKIESLAQKRLS